MKPKVLLIYIDASAREGIIPHLSSIFRNYLDFESRMIHELDFKKLNQYQMILFSSALCQSLVQNSVSHVQIPKYLCKRALNLSYIHRLLDIPAFSKVCIVNDHPKNCEVIKTALMNLGFSHFEYVFYYPEAPLPDASVQYGITPGESRYAPATIKNMIDIGNRIVDVSTLCKIVMQFNLPETILQQVSDIFFNYIGNFVRFSNRQLENVTERSLNITRIMDSLNLGVCVTSEDGHIVRYNKTFATMLGLPDTNLSDHTLPDILKSKIWSDLLNSPPLFLENTLGSRFWLYLDSHFMTVKQRPRYTFIAAPDTRTFPEMTCKPNLLVPSQIQQTSQPNMFRLLTNSRLFSPVIEQLKLYSDSPAPILLLGPDGLFQPLLAEIIHSYSYRNAHVFAQMDARNPEYVLVTDTASSTTTLVRAEDFLTGDAAGTLFIENIDHAALSFQTFLCQTLKSQELFNFATDTNFQKKKRLVFSASTLERLTDSKQFLPELFFRINSLPLQIPCLKNLREELPTFYQYYLENFLTPSGVQLNDMFSPPLLEFLLSDYDYPGNFSELQSICSYFLCIYTGKKLTLSNLPSYIQLPSETTNYNITESEIGILWIIKQNPHCGRNRIITVLTQQGRTISANQVRSILSSLAEKRYIQILKTKQGCIITELGEYMLSQTSTSTKL